MSKTKTSDYRYSEESYLSYNVSLSLTALIGGIQRGALNVGSFVILRTISTKDGRLMSVTDCDYEVVSLNVSKNSIISMKLIEIDSYRNFIGEEMTFDFVDSKGKAISESGDSFTSVSWFSSPDNKRLMPAMDRLRIYEIAYDLYKKDKNNVMFGMCLYMEEAAKAVVDEDDQIKCSPYHYPYIYPEFNERRPCSASMAGYWWPLPSVAVRMESFEQMISAVKQKIKEEDQSDVSI